MFVPSPQTRGSDPGKDFESVELGEQQQQQQEQREKVPRRIIHFSSGETMEEYSTDEEDEEEDKEAERKDLLSAPADAVRVRMEGKGDGVMVVCGWRKG